MILVCLVFVAVLFKDGEGLCLFVVALLVWALLACICGWNGVFLDGLLLLGQLIRLRNLLS